ncbi:MAG TPA: hypothetical protein VE130_03895 [Nitrososphaeraceae archaeon]|jgi:hypothetical protein|nr:hypothetical protein [Nitrososphaeraceae archaeon]
MNSVVKLILLSISIYIVWTLTTYILEGRVNLLQRVDPIGRIEYAVIANILVGTVFAFMMLKPSLRANFVTSKQLGFQSLRRTLTLVIIAIVIGFALFITSDRPATASTNPIVIANIFAQTLPTSIAEVVVCWAVIGTAFESLVRLRMHEKGDNPDWKKGAILYLDWTSIKQRKMTTFSVVSLIVGGIVSIVLFGIYHVAHSPPFNQPDMILFLMIPALLTSIFFFIGRDIYSTITIHNFLALIGISGSIDVTALTQPLYPIMIIALVSVIVLIASDTFLIRRTKINHQLLGQS